MHDLEISYKDNRHRMNVISAIYPMPAVQKDFILISF